MKKGLMLFMALVILMLVLMVGMTVALADDGTTVVAESPQFFTWAELATYAGALAATLLITQLFKGVGFIERIPTRIFSFIVSLVVLLIANLCLGGFTAQKALLCLFNAVVISLASNGAFDGIAAIKGATQDKTFYD